MPTDTPLRNKPTPQLLLRIRLLLAMEGCHGRELAAALGVAEETISRILNDRQPAVSADLLTRMELAIVDRMRARVVEERRAQGLPPTVEDPVALRAVAGLVGGGGGG